MCFAPRPTKLRSQRDINLWRIPLQLSLASVALLVLSMVSTMFGPRLLYRFLQDWVTQVTNDLFMATFVYICLVFNLDNYGDHRTSAAS